MSHNSAHQSDSNNEQERLRKHLQEVVQLSKRMLYSRALQILDGIQEKYPDKTSIAELLETAKTLRSEIVKKRRAFHIRLTIVLLFFVSLMIADILYFTRVSSTEIIAEIETRGVYIVPDHNSTIKSSPLDSIILYNADRLIMDAYAVVDSSSGKPECSVRDKSLKKHSLNPNIRTTVSPDESTGGLKITGEDLGLNLDISKAAPLSIRSTGTLDPTITITHRNSGAQGSIDAGSCIDMECTGCEVRQHKMKFHMTAENARVDLRTGELNFVGQTRPVDIALLSRQRRGNEHENICREPLRVQAVDYTDKDEKNPISLIRTATIMFPELDGKKLVISENEFLLIEGQKDLRITRLSLDNPLYLRVEGRVRSLKSGSGSFVFERMPTILEWIMKNEKGLRLFAMATSAVFTFFLAVLLRLNLLPKE